MIVRSLSIALAASATVSTSAFNPTSLAPRSIIKTPSHKSALFSSVTEAPNGTKKKRKVNGINGANGSNGANDVDNDRAFDGLVNKNQKGAR